MRGSIRNSAFVTISNLLHSDCLLRIFEYLEEDYATLRSCTLVDRFWCQTAIPMLWSNTLKIRKKFNNYESFEGYLIINIYLSTLPPDIKQSFMDKGINLSTTTKRNPTFNYATFLRVIDMRCLFVFVRAWIQQMTITKQQNHYNSKQFQFILQQLLNHFFRNSRCIHILRINNSDTAELIRNSIEQIPEPKTCLANLKELVSYWDEHQVMDIIFYELGKVARFIEKLDLTLFHITVELSSLIRAQRNLRQLTLCNKINSSVHFDPWVEGAIGSALMEKSHSITHLELDKKEFPLESLSNFNNLVELSLKYCGHENFQQSDWLPLTKVSLKNLEKLYFESKFPIYLEIFVNFIKNSGNNLRHITIHGCQIFDPEKSDLLLTSIAENCPLLKYFDGPVQSENVEELGKLFESCLQLSELYLHPSTTRCFSPVPRMNFDLLFNEITIKSANELERLAIIHGWKITSTSLEYFFENRRKKSYKPISFYWESSCTVFKGINNICQKYENLGVLQDFKQIHCQKHY
ncbi:486_t:CDS:1 [Funneliformis geosporum]|uniref:12667_t:CDS:1 n=1 Tax=Funneliformis geosporum TaxID=1117311 RepID=A0A9W4SDL0_9GLOM|nr:12667_t:CDS:1 [Funneliformis geosporum]CAI2167030.1 486_t:CDS:1 [Funneliformis geosporum]